MVPVTLNLSHEIADKLSHARKPSESDEELVERLVDAADQPVLDGHKLEYETGAKRYEDLYRAIWQNFSFMAFLAGAVLTFGKDKLGTELAAVIACIPLILWYWATFEPLNEYGDKTAMRLASRERSLSQLLRLKDGDELQLYQRFQEGRPPTEPLTGGAAITRSISAVAAALIAITVFRWQKPHPPLSLGYFLWLAPVGAAAAMGILILWLLRLDTAAAKGVLNIRILLRKVFRSQAPDAQDGADQPAADASTSKFRLLRARNIMRLFFVALHGLLLYLLFLVGPTEQSSSGTNAIVWGFEQPEKEPKMTLSVSATGDLGVGLKGNQLISHQWADPAAASEQRRLLSNVLTLLEQDREALKQTSVVMRESAAAAQQNVDTRVKAMEAKVDELLRRLPQPPTTAPADATAQPPRGTTP